MPVARKSRTQNDRPETLHTDKNDILWQEGSNLPFIQPRAGMVQRWIRTKVNGSDDDSNIYKKGNQGWEPRKYSTVPEGQRLPKVKFEGAEIIGMHNMVLMERSEELHQRYHDMRRSDILRQEQAIANDVMKFRGEETGQRQSGINSQVHTGRQPNIASDD